MKYLCEDCKYNNNGWCKQRMCNGLKAKNIQVCNTYKNVAELKHLNTNTDISAKTSTYEEQQMLLAIGNKLGQREMLYNVQRQALANNGVVDLKVLSSLSQMCEFGELAFKTKNYEGTIDQDMRLDSIKIANQNK